MNPIHVLIIDDEEELVTTLAERLAIRGIQAEGAISVAEALASLKQKSCDVVILDWKLPGMNGLDLMRQIHALYPRVKILLITGQGGMDEELAQYPGGVPPEAHEVLFKPVNIRVLVEKLHAAKGE